MTLTEIQTQIEDFIPCTSFKETAQSLPNCLCYVSEEEGFKINCDHVVFPTDFPLLPFKQPITYFSGRFGGYTNLPKQVMHPLAMWRHGNYYNILSCPTGPAPLPPDNPANPGPLPQLAEATNG